MNPPSPFLEGSFNRVREERQRARRAASPTPRSLRQNAGSSHHYQARTSLVHNPPPFAHSCKSREKIERDRVYYFPFVLVRRLRPDTSARSTLARRDRVPRRRDPIRLGPSIFSKTHARGMNTCRRPQCYRA